MASSGVPLDSSRSFRWRPRPTWDMDWIRAPRSTRTGRGLPVPPGSSRSRSATASTVSSRASTSASASRARSKPSRRRRERSGMFSSRTVKPAARAWPPKPSSRSLHSASRSNRFTPPQERQEPFPIPWSRQIINAGQPYRSVRREATMPTTPWCHSGSASSTAPFWGARSSRSTHCRKISPSMVCRSRFRAHSSWASCSPRSRSLVRRSSTAIWARPIRPEALIRGARV